MGFEIEELRALGGVVLQEGVMVVEMSSISNSSVVQQCGVNGNRCRLTEKAHILCLTTDFFHARSMGGENTCVLVWSSAVAYETAEELGIGSESNRMTDGTDRRVCAVAGEREERQQRKARVLTGAQRQELGLQLVEESG
jgi:hypothetical protein